MIEITKEPKELWSSVPEDCFRCGQATRYWYTPKDVPCCISCAREIGDADVPSKEEWAMGDREGNKKA